MRIAVYQDLLSGGAKRTLYETVRRLAGWHEIDVYSLTTADNDFCDVRPFAHRTRAYAYQPGRLFKSPFGRLNQIQRWRDLGRLDRLACQIASEIDRQTYDVVFVQPCMWTQAPLVLRYLSTPSVYYCHEPPRTLYEAEAPGRQAGRGWRSLLDDLDPLITLYRSTGRRLDWLATRSARLVLVNSQFTREAVARVYDIEPTVSYPGVDTDRFRPLAEVERRPFVLSVGAIQRHKRFDFLIESIGLIGRSARPTLKLVANVAADAEWNWLEALAARCNVDLQIEVGIGVDDLVRRYNEAAIVAYAPDNEPFGLVPLEAMACGTCVVGVAEGGVRETVVDGVTGLLVERNPNAFAAAIGGLLCNPAQMAAYGAQGRQHALRHWTWDSAVARIEQHLNSVRLGEEAAGDRRDVSESATRLDSGGHLRADVRGGLR